MTSNQFLANLRPVRSETPVLDDLVTEWPDLRPAAVEDVAGPETAALRLVEAVTA